MKKRKREITKVVDYIEEVLVSSIEADAIKRIAEMDCSGLHIYCKDCPVGVVINDTPYCISYIFKTKISDGLIKTESESEFYDD